MVILCSILNRAGGWGKGDPFLAYCPVLKDIKWGGNKWFRWLGIGLVVSIFTQNWWHLPAYFLPTWVFGYGQNHPLTKLLGRINWYIYGFMFGLASFNITFAVWTGFIFYVLMKMENDHNFDHSWGEFLWGGIATSIYIWG